MAIVEDAAPNSSEAHSAAVCGHGESAGHGDALLGFAGFVYVRDSRYGSRLSVERSAGPNRLWMSQLGSAQPKSIGPADRGSAKWPVGLLANPSAGSKPEVPRNEKG